MSLAKKEYFDANLYHFPIFEFSTCDIIYDYCIHDEAVYQFCGASLVDNLKLN